MAGQELPVDQAVTQVVNAIGGGTLDPSQLTSQPLPAPLNQIPLATLQPLLDQLPDMAIPADRRADQGHPRLADAVERDADPEGPSDLRGAGRPDRRRPHPREASVSQGDVGCAQPVSAAQLQCTTRKLALIDVLERKGYARLYGAADRKLIGKRVNVVASWNGKTVARPVGAQGRHLPGQGQAAADGPATRQPGDARYQAKLGKERSLRLKLFRRMLVTQLSSRSGKVTIKGRVVLPLGTPIQKITIKRRVSCTEERRGQVAATRQQGPLLDHARRAAERAGRGLPPGDEGAQEQHNRKLFPTFTLPRAVELKR